MIKRIALYLSWDILILIFTSSYSSVHTWIKIKYIRESSNFYLILGIQPILLILAGGIIAGFIYMSNQYQFTRKQALLELMLIGGPALYLATIIITYFLMPYHPHMYFFTNAASMTAGSIIFGYELFIFTARVIKCKKLDSPDCSGSGGIYNMKKPEEFKKVAVIGCGLIGYSWGVVFARNGLQVTMYNRKSKALDTVMDRMEEALKFLRDEGMIEAHVVQESLDRITVTTDLEEAVKDADYIQECLWEDLELKRDIFEKLTVLAPADTAIGSSCSGLRISDIITRVTHNPERCIVAHPTNPPHLIPFMEISGDLASEDIKDSVYQFMEALGQKPIKCKEVYGYVLNRIQLSLIQESLYLVKEGICSVEAVERAVTDGLGLRWAFTGPYGVEELNSANLEEGLTKYKDYMLEFFTNQQKRVADYDEQFVKQAAAEFQPIMKGKSHEEYLKWRDEMVIRTRMLKRSNP